MEKLKRKNEIIDLMKSYDFKKNTIKSFSELYGPSTRTISRYLNEYHLDYNRSKKNILRERDVNGQFLPELKPDIKKKINQINLNTDKINSINEKEKHVTIRNFKFNNKKN